jgi:RNA polymerase sigma factor (sigma-70 family)
MAMVSNTDRTVTRRLSHATEKRTLMPLTGNARAKLVMKLWLDEKTLKRLRKMFHYLSDSGDHQFVDDLVSDTVLRFCEKIEQGEGSNYPSLKQLLFGIARNVWKEQQRPEARPKVDPDLHELQRVRTPESIYADEDELRQWAELARAAIDQLSERDYQILCLDLMDKSSEEIIEELGLNIEKHTVDNIRSALPHKLRKLVKLYTKLG